MKGGAGLMRLFRSEVDVCARAQECVEEVKDRMTLDQRRGVARHEGLRRASDGERSESNPEPAPLPKQKNKKFSVLNKINDRKLFKSE